MDALPKSLLRQICPVKWHEKIPKDGISLGVADIDFRGPEGIVTYIKRHLKEHYNFYQNRRGLNDARETAATYLSGRGIKSTTEEINIIEGTMMGISVVMEWIAEKNGEMVILGPIYEPIHRHAKRKGNKIQWIEIDEDREYIDQLTEVVTNNTKMITMCDPNNPTGHVYSSKELQAISDLSVDHDCFIFSDELYEPLDHRQSFTSISSYSHVQDRVISSYGFSKAYGLAGWRAGFLRFSPEFSRLQYLLEQTMVSPSPVTSLITKFALNNKRSKEWVSEFKGYCEKITKFATKKFVENDILCNLPESSFFVFPDINVDSKTFTERLLNDYGVQVVAGSVFGPMSRTNIRITCATSMERLEKGINRITQALGKIEH